MASTVASPTNAGPRLTSALSGNRRVAGGRCGVPRRSPRLLVGAPDLPVRVYPSSRAALHDPRGPAIADALAALHERERHAIRIVDAECGAGCFLLQALRYAHALGFTGIEGRGSDGVPALVGRAQAAADLLIWHGDGRAEPPEAAWRAGVLVIGDGGTLWNGRAVA